MRQLKADLSAIAMAVLAKPEIKVASFLSLDHKDNIRILLDASTVSQILKLGRSLLLDVVSVQLTEQNHRTAAILGQSFEGLGCLSLASASAFNRAFSASSISLASSSALSLSSSANLSSSS